MLRIVKNLNITDYINNIVCTKGYIEQAIKLSIHASKLKVHNLEAQNCSDLLRRITRGT